MANLPYASILIEVEDGVGDSPSPTRGDRDCSAECKYAGASDKLDPLRINGLV